MPDSLLMPELARADASPLRLVARSAGRIATCTAAGAAAAPMAPAGPLPRRVDSAFGPLLLRALAAGDAAAHAAFLLALGEEGRRMRAFALPPSAASVVATAPAAPAAPAAPQGAGAELLQGVLTAGAPGGAALMGELTVCIDRTRIAAEFALAVRPELHGCGLGRLLMACLLDACRLRRVSLVCGSAPAGAAAMLALARACGFQILRAADGSAQLALMLRPRGVR